MEIVKSDYLSFIYRGLSKSSGDALRDGEYLAGQCLNGLNAIDKDRFPPRLLILLASPTYLQQQKAEQLVRGVYDTFSHAYPDEDVQLIGSSVAGVFFNHRIHPEGALLVCLASRLIEAQVACGMNARQDPKGAIDELLGHLELDPLRQIDPNPLANRMILTFLPGCSQAGSNGGFYPAPELHRRLHEGVRARVMLVGGVSSANDPSRKADGLQFAQRQVLRDSVVAASVITGVPIGVSLNDGLVSTDKILRVTKLAEDGRTVLEFDNRSAQEQIGRATGQRMLAKLSADNERTVDIPLPKADGSVQLLRQLKVNDYFQVLQPGTQIFETARKGIEQAKQRVYVENPIASLLFPYRAYNPRRKSSTLDAEAALVQIEEYLNSRPCVGGFFDGELGIDETGRSRLSIGGVGYVIFGDEIRERTPLYKGFSALADYGPKVLARSDLTTGAIYEEIINDLNIVDQTGFPGAMISLVASNLDGGTEEKEFIIAREAIGPRFSKIIDHTQRSYESNDILVVVAQDGQPRFIPDSSKDPFCNQEAIEISGIISQYVLPLKRLDATVFGILQVDVGDLRHLSHDEFLKTEKARVLDCFAEVFSAGITRIANAIENDIMLRLDTALRESLSANSVHEGLDKFFKAAGEAFGVEMGHLRLVKFNDGNEASNGPDLVLETGFGACYKAEKESRRRISANDSSPICCAFQSKERLPQLVNDVTNDPAWRTILESVRCDSKLSTELSLIRSYAAVAFNNERNEPLGAISFGSTVPWFFLKFHRSALIVLAERLGFLVEHLRSKIQRNFLLTVSPKLAERNLYHAEAILKDVTEVFRGALNADVASLYLWDMDREKYILRAESNWKDEGWVSAASYGPDAGWIGVKAINKEPLYVADLRKYYLEHGYAHPNGRYAEYMFGEPLSDNFVVEAIGLPLRIGSKTKDKFGVLTLYRRVDKRQPNGFVTTDINLLQEGAYNAAGLVNAILRHRDDIWEKEEDNRRQEVYQAINADDDNESFEAKVCREVLKSYQAAEVEFYRVDEQETVMKHSWVAGYHRQPGTGEIERKTQASNEHSEIIEETRSNAGGEPAYEIAVRRRQLKKGENSDPAALKIHGLVEKVCIPLLGDQKCLAALVIRWRLSPKISFLPKVQHDSDHLQKLGHIIGSTYLRNQITREREQSDRDRQQSDLALVATNAYAVQRAHLLRNTINEMYDFIGEMEEHAQEFNCLNDLIKVAMGIVNETMDLGERVLCPSYVTCQLSWLISETLKEGNELLRKRITELGIRYINQVPPNLMVRVDPSHTKEAFFNIISNATDAIVLNNERGKKIFDQLGISYNDHVPQGLMVRADPSEAKYLASLINEGVDPAALKKYIETMLVVPELNISVASVNAETTTLVISDNGKGMIWKEILVAMKGFVRAKDGHKGVGVLLSRVLLAAQGSTLTFKSEKYKGTDAILTLPSAARSGENRWNYVI